MLMSFRSIRRHRAVTRLLFFVLVSADLDVASGFPIVTVPCDCPEECDQSRLDSIKALLTSIYGIVATLNDPATKEECRVYMASYGYDDSILEAYVKTSAVTSDAVLGGRGVIVMELDPATCTTRNRQTFDTWGSPALETAQLLETLTSAATGTIIVGVSVDSAETGNLAFQSLAGFYFTRYNMNINGLAERDKFVFIMQKGYPKKSIIARQPRYGENLRMRVALIGSKVHDVTFSRV